ncbi:MAG: copper homeostasis protein CutC [Bacteroidales bacterium]|jgi:copper homeostasis protein|nr:copper homeostasis protein CutC [Bacteroidales bacterium]
MLIEICADSIDSARIAQSAGAGRVELCANLSEGGTTPSFALIEVARKLLTIKLNVLIRPRGGDFLYNDLEFELMKSDIHHCGKIGCDGVVTGILHADGRVDVQRCRELVGIAESYSMSVTFHRAIDRCVDIFQGLEDVIAAGCGRVLTSGGKNTAIEAAPVIKQLLEQAKGRIIIMAGAGVTPENIAELVEKTGVNEIHGTFRSRQDSAMIYKNTELSNQEQEYGIWLADAEKIKKSIKIL